MQYLLALQALAVLLKTVVLMVEIHNLVLLLHQ
jgi:hypothetical protein